MGIAPPWRIRDCGLLRRGGLTDWGLGVGKYDYFCDMHALALYFQKKYPDSFRLVEHAKGDFILFKPFSAPTTTVLMTLGLSDYEMPVHEKHQGEEFNELFVLLPSYWNIEDKENERFNWVFSWLQRLKDYVIDRKTWLGHGHTLPCGAEMNPISTTMLQNHLILLRPDKVSEDLSPILIEGKTIGFLALIPLFGDEMDYKQGKGTLKLLQKFKNAGVTEQLDDFRKTVLKTRWTFFG